MNPYETIYNFLLENGQSDYHSKVKGLISAIKKAVGTPEAATLRTQLDQRMKKHYQGMGDREFMDFSSDLISTSKSKKGKGK